MAHTPDADPAPPTRWELHTTGERWQFYIDRFARMYAAGDDLEGEARFVDALAARGSAVLDAGCGTGRIAAALTRMGHTAVGTDRDAGLIEIARQRYPDTRFLTCDLLSLTPELLVSSRCPAAFDVIVLAGNVMVYLAPGTEVRAVAGLAGLLRPGGRFVAGFATDRDYRVDDFRADLAAAGLQIEQEFASWHLDPWSPSADWVVTVARAPLPEP